MKGMRHAAELVFAAILLPAARLLRLVGWRPRGITVVGWWGSETVGDVAILGQLLDECKETAPELSVTIVSFDATRTRATLAELGRDDVTLMTTGPASAWAIVGCRVQIVGGGPLMESPSMPLWAWRGRLARAAGARVLLYANGIGPIRTPRAERAIVRLVRTATHIVVRDSTSRQWCEERAGRTDTVQSFDPAYDYVRGQRMIGRTRRAQLALALRAAPAAYLGAGDSTLATARFLDAIATALNAVVGAHDIQIVGIVMHTGFADSDDALLYEQLRARLSEPARLIVPASQRVQDVIRILEESHVALTVRFHAMVFSLATDTPFVAIDYARPAGKVSAAAADVGREADVIVWDAVAGDGLAVRLRALLDVSGPRQTQISDGSSSRREQLQSALS